MGIRVETTKREKTAARIIEGIESGLYPRGERLPFNADLAAKFGVSIGTVSNALYDVQRAGYMNEKSRNGSWVVAMEPSTDVNTLDALIAARADLAQGKRGIEAAAAANRAAAARVDAAIEALRGQVGGTA